MPTLGRPFFALWLLFLVASVTQAQAPITTPFEEFGFDLGDDYQLANYRQLTDYWRKLEQESDRMVVEEIGTTAEGRTMLMAVITSPENHRRLDRYREISRRLALAHDLSEEAARDLAAEGRAVVWIDGGIHATEVLGAQQLMQLVYEMVSGDDSETLRILADVILLAVCANPDGLDLVADWYMREAEPEERSTRDLPRLYHKYIGHDNNRDFYMATQPESEAINRILYRVWFPQIAYNHHQTGPAGTVLFAPPFRDPFNYNLDPLIPVGLELVGAAMHGRFVAEGKGGATMRSGARYSTWWNGGLRTTQYFHNIIGLLTETIGSPNPIEIPLILMRQLPQNDLPLPIAPQQWHFRQSLDYSITANRAVLDVASRNREVFLFNMYRMARNSIERGSRDHWTITPKKLAAVEEAVKEDEQTEGDVRSRWLSREYYTEVLRRPETRDPRGYVLPSDQVDFLTAGKFINALMKNGVAVHRATAPFDVDGTRYPAGSYVIKTAQAFRPHVLDMFEPQDHPHDIPYPGGPPTPPYDSAGWTLAFQMGVEFVRVLEGFDGPFEEVTERVKPVPGKVLGSERAAGYLLDHRLNDSFVALNRLMADRQTAFWLKDPFVSAGRTYPPGTIYVPASSSLRPKLEKMAQELGLSFEGTPIPPEGRALKLRPVRIGLWDRYGGSMPSGWLRWIFEQFEFPFEVVFAPTLDEGNLAEAYDVLVFVGGAIPGADEESSRLFRGSMPDPDTIPEEFRPRLGRVSVDATIPKLKEFLAAGGTILAIGGSTALADHLGLPLADPLREKLPGGGEQRLPREKYYVPGSILEVRVDPRQPLAYGMPERANVYFNNSPVFRQQPHTDVDSLRSVAWFDSSQLLRSGWAWGEQYLEDAVAVLDVSVGPGKLFLYGPEVTFRAQPHGTFKLVFNGIYYGPASEVDLP